MFLKRVYFALIFVCYLFDNHSNSKQLSYSIKNKNFSVKATSNTGVTAHVTERYHNKTSIGYFEKCLPPNLNDFPTDMFTQSQRRFGAIIFHFIFAGYLLMAIMRVCDDYFMNSLEIIGQKLNLDQDVAGATFMAAGSSAPEVFISLIGK